MQPTVLQIVAILVQILPPAVAPFARGALGPARRWVVLWCLLLVLQDAVGYGLASLHLRNLWLWHVGAPVTGAAALWMLSLWHEPGTGRLALRVAIPIFVGVSAALSLLVDDPTTFSLFAAPFHALVLLLAAVWTFVSRSLREQRRLVSCDWFWILTGLMLYTGISTAIQAVVGVLFEAGRLDLISAIFQLKAGLTILAFVAIAGGMLRPLVPTPERPSSGNWPSP